MSNIFRYPFRNYIIVNLILAVSLLTGTMLIAEPTRPPATPTRLHTVAKTALATVTYSVEASPFPTQTNGVRRIFLDVDKDGDKDVLYQTTASNTGADIFLKINNSGDFSTTYAADAAGAFTSGPLNGISFPTFIFAGSTAGGQSVIDYDHDGDDDIFENENNGVGRLIRNNGNSTFTVLGTSPFPTQVNGSRRVFLDADNDGDIDMLYQTSTTNGTDIALKLNNGSGDFSTTHLATNSTGAFTSGPLNGVSFSGLIVATRQMIVDYDNDGDDDIFENADNSIGRIIRNNGNGTFTDLATSPFVSQVVAPGAFF